MLTLTSPKEQKQSQWSTRRALNSQASNSKRIEESSLLIQLLNAIYENPDKTVPTAELLRKLNMSNQGHKLIQLAKNRGYIIRYREKSDYRGTRKSSCIMNKLTVAGEGFLLSHCCRG